MPNPQTSPASTALRLLLTAAVAAGAALAVNYVVMPSAARYIFSRRPPVDLQRLEQQKNKLVEGVVLSMMASMIGPPESPAPSEPVASNGPSAPPPKSEGDDKEAADQPSDRPKTDRQRVAEAKPAPSNPDPAAGEPAEGPPEPPEQPDVPDKPQVFTIDRAQINRRLRTPGTVSRKISVVSAAGKDGKPQGLKVQRLDGFYSQFGLRPGDVVLAVNGRQVTDRQSAIKQVASMRQRTAFVLDVRRGGKSFQIKYRVPHLSPRHK